MGERNDVDLGFAKVTRKTMPNGEVRTRMKLVNGLTTTITEMPHWNPKDGIPWQEEHFHKGLTESYVIISGCVALFFEHKGQLTFSVPRVSSGYPDLHFSFVPHQSHIILPGPGCTFLTATHGRPVGNPDKGGNDWWQGSGELLKRAKSFEEHVLDRMFYT